MNECLFGASGTPGVLNILCICLEHAYWGFLLVNVVLEFEKDSFAGVSSPWQLLWRWIAY